MKDQKGFIDFTPIFLLALIGIIFGFWKIIEIIIWLFKHVRIQ